MDIILEFLLVFLVFFSPLIYGSVTILPQSLLEATSFLLLFLFLLNRLSKDRTSFIKISFLPLLVFLGLVCFQLFPLPEKCLSFISPAAFSLFRDFRANSLAEFPLSIYPEATVKLLLQFLSYLAVFFVVLNYMDTLKKIKRLALAIIICGFLYSFYGIIHWLAIYNPDFSTFTNRDHFAAYVEMIIPLGIGYTLAEVSKTRKIIIVFMVSVITLALFLSLSRAGIISFSLGILILLALLKSKRPLKKGIGIVIALVLFLTLFLGVIGPGSLGEQLKSLLSPLSVYQERLNLLKDSFKIVKDFPIFGTGLGTFGEIFQKYNTSSKQVTWNFAHNEPMQLLVETGVLGFLLVFFFLFNYSRKIIFLWFKRNSPYALYLTLGGMVGIFSISVHSLFDFVFHVPADALLFFIILALIYRSVYLKEPQTLLPLPNFNFSLPHYLRFSLIIALVIPLIFIASLIFRRYQAEMVFDRIKEAQTAESLQALQNYKRALKEIDTAIAWNPLDSSYLGKKGNLLSGLALRDDLKNELPNYADFISQNNLLFLAGGSYRKAIDLNPTQADYHLKLGWIYSLLGDTKMMKEEFKKAMILDPQNNKIRSYINTFKQDI